MDTTLCIRASRNLVWFPAASADAGDPWSRHLPRFMRNLWRVRPRVTRRLPQAPLAPGRTRRNTPLQNSIWGRFDPHRSDRFHRGIQGEPKVFHEVPRTLKMAEESHSAHFAKQNIHTSMHQEANCAVKISRRAPSSFGVRHFHVGLTGGIR